MKTTTISFALALALLSGSPLVAGAASAYVTKAGASIAVPAIRGQKTASAAADASSPKEWTLMIFMNSKNNLESAAMVDVNEMELAGSTDKLNVVVEVAREGAPEIRFRGPARAEKSDWSGVRRYFIQKDYIEKPGQTAEEAMREAMSEIRSPVVGESKTSDMGNYNSVVSFVRWAKKNYPAKKYMLVLWNHGSGWADPKPDTIRGISFDFKTKNYIRTGQLRPMLAALGGVDVLAMDACLMQQLEIAYEVRDGAQILVASEDLEPEYGYNYTDLIRKLSATPQADAKEAAIITVDTYADFYQQYQQHLHKSGIQSAIDLSKIDDLSAALSKWVDAALATPDSPTLLRAKKEVMRFSQYGTEDGEMNITTYADLYDFIEFIRNHTYDPDLKDKSATALAAVKAAILHNRTVGQNMIGISYSGRAHGLGINLPRVTESPTAAEFDKRMESLYSQLSFPQKTGWIKLYSILEKLGRSY